MLSRKKNLRDSASGVADQLRPHVEEARKKAAPALAEARTRAEEARSKAEPALREAAAKARVEGSRAAKEARAKAAPALEEARSKAAPLAEEARKRVQPALEEARDAASPYLAEARRQVEPAFDEARKRVAPVLDEARTKAAPLAEEARRRAEDLYDERVLPTVATALTMADDATSDIRHEAGRRGTAAVAALKGEVQAPPERHRGRNLVVALGLAGVAGFVAKKLGDRQAAAAWESAYTTTPPRPATPKSGDDIGGGNPGEAVADGAEVPHAATTPDAPVETVEVEDRETGPGTTA